jgi:peroxiredoxin-like protein
MTSSLDFVSSAQWTGERHGVVIGHGVGPSINFSAPPEFQGEPGIWTPEHFLTSAVATCYVTTFYAIATHSNFPLQSLEVSVNGHLEKEEGGYRFTRITVRPVLTIQSESDRDRAMRLLQKTEKACLVSRSLKSEIVLEPSIVLAPVATLV